MYFSVKRNESKTHIRNQNLKLHLYNIYYIDIYVFNSQEWKTNNCQTMITGITKVFFILKYRYLSLLNA